MKLRILAAITWLVSVDTRKNAETSASGTELFLRMLSQQTLTKKAQQFTPIVRRLRRSRQAGWCLDHLYNLVNSVVDSIRLIAASIARGSEKVAATAPGNI
jgi:hypothetical protein